MSYLKGGIRVLANYSIALLIFSFFILTFLNYKVVYSFVMFLIMAVLIHSDIKKLAIKEKKPQYNLKPHPLKGFVFGLIGFSPFMVLILVYPMINFADPIANNIKRVIFNGLLGPLYFFIKLGGSTYTMYLVSILIVPVISMLSYMAGYYGFDLRTSLKKQNKTARK